MGGADGGRPFRALRAYNTGRVVDARNLDATGGAGTVSYVNDVANRLLGWNGRGGGVGIGIDWFVEMGVFLSELLVMAGKKQNGMIERVVVVVVVIRECPSHNVYRLAPG